MITSRIPWTTRHLHAEQGSAEMLDADGLVIGSFFDWRNADACATQSTLDPNLAERLKDTEERESDLTEELENLKQSIREQVAALNSAIEEKDWAKVTDAIGSLEEEAQA